MSTLSCFFGFLLLFLSSVKGVREAFIEFSVEPDVVPVAPSSLATVIYQGNVTVLLGNELRPSQMMLQPFVDWNANADSFYTLAMVDPDVPSRLLPLLGEFLHWLVGNIPGNNLMEGQVLASYFPATPPPLTGFHRYVFLIYEQPQRIVFNTTLLDFSTMQLRVSFSINNFAIDNNLGDPQFGNFCRASALV